MADTRLQFTYNQGIRYGCIGYYHNVDEAFDACKNFLPYASLKIGTFLDFTSFKLGYKKGERTREKTAKMKAQADAKISEYLSKV